MNSNLEPIKKGKVRSFSEKYMLFHTSHILKIFKL